MGWILVIFVVIIDVFLTKSAIKSYHDMKEAKRKAMIWDARMK